ncbi:hypothetical protein [Flagellimonas aurea]|uniref:hypothetical protein n=1 Tax=Flagellimonas aurea TaxID=2915619 RepID=UPI0035D0AD6D
MIEHIYQYYQSEQNTAYIAAAIGMVFLASTFILFQYFENDRLIKGLSYVFCIAGLFFLTAGISVAIHNDRKMEEVKLSSLTNMELYKSETERMELVIQKGYRSALFLFSSLVVAGLVVLLISPNDLWKGIGLGLLIIGTIGHGTEAFSMQKNKAYQQKIDSINVQNI